jgi:RNA polymerase sigma-70 factor (ECF subfamily)
LFRILKNAFINGYRHAKAGPKEVDLGAGEDEALDAAGSKAREAGTNSTPEEGLLAAALDRGVADALAALPEDFRLVVELVDLQDFSYREVADILEVPLGTVMSRLYRGRRLLESALLEYGRRRHYFGPNKPTRTRLAAGGPGASRAPEGRDPVTLSEYRRRRER